MSKSPSGNRAWRSSLTSSSGMRALTWTPPSDSGSISGVLDVELVDDLAQQLLDDVLQGDEAGRAAVLVDHDRHVERGRAIFPQQGGDALGLRHEPRRGRIRSATVASCPPVPLGPHQVLRRGRCP